MYKDPVTDPGKVSKKGRLALVEGNGGALTTLTSLPRGTHPDDVLVPVFEDGALLVDESLDAVRDRAALPPTLPSIDALVKALAPPST